METSNEALARAEESRNHTVKIYIDRVEKISPAHTTGIALYNLGQVPNEYVLFREMEGRRDDELVQKTNAPIHLKEWEHSAVAEQLIRLGVGRLSEFDSQCLEASNTTRVYGSGLKDAGQPKVEIIRRHSDHIGLGTNVTAVDSDITQRASAELLRDCDVIFGCTDDELGRSILCRMATDYYIPVFDMGVKINSKDGEIVSVEGRVTTLVPGTACLFCRGRITAEGVSANVIAKHSKAQIDELRQQG